MSVVGLAQCGTVAPKEEIMSDVKSLNNIQLRYTSKAITAKNIPPRINLPIEIFDDLRLDI